MESSYSRKLFAKDAYEGFGLIEALIGILICSIACLVLLQISALELRRVKENEEYAIVSQVASEAATMTEIVIEKAKLQGINPLPAQNGPYPVNPGCYALSGTIDNPAIGSVSVCNYDGAGRSSCLQPGRMAGEYSNFFRVMCIQNPIDSNNDLRYKATVYSGLYSCRLRSNGACSVLDTKYTFIVNL